MLTMFCAGVTTIKSTIQVHQALGLTSTNWVWAVSGWCSLAKCQTLVSGPVVCLQKVAYENIAVVHVLCLSGDFVSEAGSFSMMFPPSDVMLCLFHSVVKYHLRNLAIQSVANSKIHNPLLAVFVTVLDNEYPNRNWRIQIPRHSLPYFLAVHKPYFRVPYSLVLDINYQAETVVNFT